ncbi:MULTISPECIES: hypothetical protein [Flavobacterium]|uniref:HEPN AbiU2-like domain-containing protein n=1 Tax=Flavobacterium columnare TaxID=996 RepID=A0AA94F258_9FLAO|nr:hypothetical protein [Flavobacterium columnare]MCH4828628.1 hypothetical protein [Flavobacterium columnare]MCH4831881.1 hypothetical protein [Flavobacterium columnare]
MMKPEIEERLVGLDNIIQSLNNNIQLLEYISYNLHRETFSLNNNLGLIWIWQNLMAIQIIDFYKVIVANEKFSFSKIFNVSNGLKEAIDFDSLNSMIADLNSDYDNHKFEVVRSKYLAHQDLNVAEIKTDIVTIRHFTDKIISTFLFLTKELNWKHSDLNNNVQNSFKEIFERIDEYEKVSAYLMAAEIKGEKTIEIEELANSIKQ